MAPFTLLWQYQNLKPARFLKKGRCPMELLRGTSGAKIVTERSQVTSSGNLCGLKTPSLFTRKVVLC